jgi:hypothetical protein
MMPFRVWKDRPGGGRIAATEWRRVEGTTEVEEHDWVDGEGHHPEFTEGEYLTGQTWTAKVLAVGPPRIRVVIR